MRRPNTSSPNIKYLRGTPAKAAERFGFETIQGFRIDAIANGLSIDIDTLHGGESDSDRQRQLAVKLFGKATLEEWCDSNAIKGRKAGQRFSRERVTFALGAQDEPLAYWRTARNVSSGFERKRVEAGKSGIITTVGGVIERGFKRVFSSKSHTFVSTNEYGALPKHESLIPIVGAIALDSYGKDLPGSAYVLPQDQRAQQNELPSYGYKPDDKSPLHWTVPTIGEAKQKMLEVAGIPELPQVTPL